MKKVKNLKVRIAALTLLASSVISLCGCELGTELAADEQYDIIENQNGDDNLTMGLTQVLDVPGEDFKLVTQYSCDDESKRQLFYRDMFAFFEEFQKRGCNVRKNDVK